MAEGHCEVELPEPIIQRIQSFLTGKEAAQTSTLSKSWHEAWLTRPNLDFHERYYDDNFWELANKTIQRYEDSNLKIESFRLFLQSKDNFVLANLLIVKALKLCGSHLRLEIEQRDSINEKFVIAPEVFESENLVGLSVKRCGIDIGVDHNVRCYKLESLNFSSLKIKNLAVISNIISSCPLIRNLSLSIDNTGWVDRDLIDPPKLQNLECLVLSRVEKYTLEFFRDMSNFPSLKDLTPENLSVDESFTVGMHPRIESLSLDTVYTDSRTIFKLISSCPMIENLSLSSVCRKKGSDSFPINLPKLHNLKRLTLSRVKLKDLVLSYKLPALKHLTLDEIFQNDDQEVLRISSRSLERLDLLVQNDRSWTPHVRTSMFKLDVPSIRKFVIEAWSIPSVSFESTSEEWESHVSMNFSVKNVHNAWFLELNELLTALSPSKSHLSVKGRGRGDMCFDYKIRDVQGLPQPRVENLTLDIPFLPSLNCYALFDGLFRICRPQLVTQYQYPESTKSDPTRTNTNDFLSERLEQGMNGEFSSPGNFMYGLHGLKEVHVQVLDVAVGVVSDLPRKPWMVSLEEEAPKPNQKILFQLVWKPKPDKLKRTCQMICFRVSLFLATSIFLNSFRSSYIHLLLRIFICVIFFYFF